MPFDFDEARRTIEEAKKRGLIREKSSPDFDPAPPAKSAKAKSAKAEPNAVIPDWLQKSIEDTAG